MLKYAFYFLDPTQQRLYKLFRNEVFRHTQYIPVREMDANSINLVLKAVLTDTPELFWFEGRWEYVRVGNAEYVHPLYTIDIAESLAIQNRVDKMCSYFLKKVDPVCKIDRIRYAYDWMISNVEYGISDGRGQTIHDAFIKRKAVCKGLSKGFQYLLKLMGIFSMLREGTLDGTGRHVWNIVENGGRYFNVDISMGYDCFSYLFEDSRGNDKYRCFMVSDSGLSDFHRINHLLWPSVDCNQNFPEGS